MLHSKIYVMTQQRRIDIDPFKAIGGILVAILVFWGLFMVAKLAFKVLVFASPLLLIGAAIVDYTVITDFVKWVFKMLKENPLMGIAAIMLTVFGFPIIAGFLFGKAYLRKKVRKMASKYDVETKGEIVDYEEVEDIEEDFEKLVLPPKRRAKPEPIRQKRAEENSSDDYEQLFD